MNLGKETTTKEIMGCACSSDSSSANNNKSIRLVHLNGHIEEFNYPVTVCEVTTISPNHFVCTPAQLLSDYSKPLMPNTPLKPGQVYFLLPFSVLSTVSPEDFIPVVKKLVSIARSKRFKTESKSKSSSCRSPASSHCQLPAEKNVTGEQGIIGLAGPMQKSTKSRIWKPILATIRERSFNRRSESDLQEKS